MPAEGEIRLWSVCDFFISEKIQEDETVEWESGASAYQAGDLRAGISAVVLGGDLDPAAAVTTGTTATTGKGGAVRIGESDIM